MSSDQTRTNAGATAPRSGQLAPIALKSSADGWRGKIGGAFSPNHVERLVTCILRHLVVGSEPRILLGHDGRAAGAEAVAIVRRVIAAEFVDARVIFLPHLPTPVASGILAADRADIAILVTASHNPAEWNGIKVKTHPSRGLSSEIEAAINRDYHRNAVLDGGAWIGASQEFSGLDSATHTATSNHASTLLEAAGVRRAYVLRVVVDGLNGVGGAPFAALCARLGYVVHSVGTEPVEDFGGMKPDPTIVESQVRCADLVRTLGADLGFILDGDGDRLIVLDHEGLPVQSQELLAILLHFAPPELASRLSGPIFVTTTCGEMVRRVGELRGTPVTETGVGFKHVAPLLWAATRSCGVGSVGDLGFRDLAADRDPMAVAIVLAMVLGHTGANLRALHRQLQAQLGLAHLHWDERHFPASEKGDDLESCARLHATAEGWLESVPELTVDGVRMRGPAGQWLMVRKSTTESGYRLYGEFHAGAGPVNSA